MRLIFRLRLNRSLVRIPLQKFIEKEMNYWGQPTLIRPRYEPIFDHYTRQKQQKTERTSVTSDSFVLNTLFFYQKYFCPKTVSSFIAYWAFFKVLVSSNVVDTAIPLRNRFRKKLYFRVSCMIFRFILNSFFNNIVSHSFQERVRL